MRELDLERAAIPDLWVERLVAGELEPAQAAALRARLEAEHDPRLRAYALDEAAFNVHYPASRVVPEIETRAGHAAAPTRSGALWIAASAAVAALITLFFVARSLFVPATPPPLVAVVGATGTGSEGNKGAPTQPEHIRLKGLAPHLVLYREVPGGAPEALVPGTHADAGTRVQLSYVAARAKHGVIFSLDGTGAVTLHYPSSADGETTLRARGEVPLPFSYELDDAPKYERFVFVSTGADQLSTQEVLDAARRLADAEDPRTAPLELPDLWSQSSFLVTK